VSKRKYGAGAIAFVSLVILITFFAAAFSMQGFLELGADLTANIDTWPLLGWIIGAIASIPNVQVVGFILAAFIGFKCWKAKGFTFVQVLGLLAAVAMIGGAETLNNNIGAIAGFCLFAWFNAVQLSSWAGQIAGFNASWARDLKPYIVFFYLAEVGINLVRFPPYGDGQLGTFFSDLQYGALDPALIQWSNLAWMFISVAAVEATAVFFIKYCHAIRRQLEGRGRTPKQARPARPAQRPYTAQDRGL